MSAARAQFQNYDKHLISIFEVLGAHYVDIFFNHVYTYAQSNTTLTEKKSLTDVYIHAVRIYVASIKTNEKSYQETVGKLFEYYKNATRHRNSSFVDFQETILQQFIPDEWYERCQTKQKDEAFCNILTDLISNLGAYMTKPDMLRRVIDLHSEQHVTTIRMAQDKAITILITKRDETHNRFLGRLGQTRESVSSEVVEKLKDAVRKLVRDKGRLKDRVLGLEGELEDAAAEARDYRKRYQAAQKKVTQLRKLAELLVKERQVGARRAAFSAAVPPPNDEGEISDEPAPARPPPRDRVGEPREPAEPLPRTRVAESFFESPLVLGQPAEAQKPLAQKPLAREAPRRRRRGASPPASDASSEEEEEDDSDEETE